jgi:hypothetical protein
MMRLRQTLFTWRAAAMCSMAITFWWLAFPVAYRLAVPPSVYMDVRSIYVADAPVGGDPSVTIDRDINRAFTGRNEATVRVMEPDGTIWEYCRPGVRDDIAYTAGRQYPGRALNWWLGSPPADACDLVPGTYKLRIEWTINAFFGLVPLHVTRESAPFTIYDPAAVRQSPVSIWR